MVDASKIVAAVDAEEMAYFESEGSDPDEVPDSQDRPMRGGAGSSAPSGEPGLASDFGEFRIASMDGSQSCPLSVAAETLQFRRRRGPEGMPEEQVNVGHLVRHVALLGREYLVVRVDPDNGGNSTIELFGVGFRNPHNDDIVLMGGQAACPAEQEPGEEPGLFVADPRAFRRRERLGTGGFGEVYRYCRLDFNHHETDEQYAVKELDMQKLARRSGANQDAKLVRWIARLEGEVRNLMKLRGHPGVVCVHDAFAYRGRFYIVMELVAGTDLGRRLREKGRLSEQEAKHIFVQMAEALRHSHALDVVHRDLKPDNVLLAQASSAEEEAAKLIDFGLSKDLSHSFSGAVTPMLGTKDYMAPEVRKLEATQLRNEEDAGKVDVYGLGATLFAMLSGKPPQEAEEVTDLSFRPEVWRRVSQDARDLLLGMLRDDPHERLDLGSVLEHPWVRSEVGGSSSSTSQPKKDPEHYLLAPFGALRETPGGSPGGRARPRKAFPEAPSYSAAGRIRAESGTAPTGHAGTGPAQGPGWGVIFSWLRADAAAAAARSVFLSAGMRASGRTGFGRVPPPGLPPADASGMASPATEGAQAAGKASLNNGAQEEKQSPLDNSQAEGATPAGVSDHAERSGHIRWLACAPRFAASWRLARGVGCPPPNSPYWQAARGASGAAGGDEDVLASPPADADTAAEDPPALPGHSGEDRQPQMGFVHAPGLPDVDGLMVTVVCANKPSPVTKSARRRNAGAWGFISEVRRGHGYCSREEAMRAAERALLPNQGEARPAQNT